jgi:two-component system, OmpR family, response regulator
MIEHELKRILYIEDETDIQTVAKMALESLGGFKVEVCNSGAIALVRAPAFMPDLILLDVMMPGMDGPATLTALRTLPEIAATPVIFMTAKAQKGEIENYKKMGAVDVIPKPFDPMTLAKTVRDIWTRHGHNT